MIWLDHDGRSQELLGLRVMMHYHSGSESSSARRTVLKVFKKVLAANWSVQRRWIKNRAVLKPLRMLPSHWRCCSRRSVEIGARQAGAVVSWQGPNWKLVGSPLHCIDWDLEIWKFHLSSCTEVNWSSETCQKQSQEGVERWYELLLYFAHELLVK